MGRIQGSSNFSFLTDKGESQAEITRGIVAEEEYDACLASPLRRARQTADVVWGRRDASAIREDRDLREIDLYAFEGLFKDEGRAKFGDAYDKWKESPNEFVIEGHHPVRELWDRATSVWERSLSGRGGEQKILVVAHNAMNQALIGSALGLGPNYFRRLLQSNCAVSKVVLDENFAPNTGKGIVLEYLNQTPEVPLGQDDSVTLIHCPSSVEDEAVITTSVINMLRMIPVRTLMHTKDGSSTRLAGEIIERCKKESIGECPFAAIAVESIDESTKALAETAGFSGSTFIVADKSFCQNFIAQTLVMESGEMFNLSPGGITVFDMNGGPKKDPVAVCINHRLYLPSFRRDFNIA